MDRGHGASTLRRAVALVVLLMFAMPLGAERQDRAAARLLTSTKAGAIAVLAGGCFWGVEAVFEHVRGVRSVTSGYGHYDGAPTRKLEAVRIEYDPAQVTYEQLLDVFFQVAHDPTTRDRQGPDEGPEYRSVVLYGTDAERRTAENYISDLARTRQWRYPIVTEVRALTAFDVAETSHQDFAARNPTNSYIIVNDLPKLELLRKRFPGLYKVERAR